MLAAYDCSSTIEISNALAICLDLYTLLTRHLTLSRQAGGFLVECDGYSTLRGCGHASPAAAIAGGGGRGRKCLVIVLVAAPAAARHRSVDVAVRAAIHRRVPEGPVHSGTATPRMAGRALPGARLPLLHAGHRVRRVLCALPGAAVRWWVSTILKRETELFRTSLAFVIFSSDHCWIAASCARSSDTPSVLKV